MMTAMLAVQNILNGDQCFNLWKVNQDANYHEEGNEKEGGRLVRKLSMAIKKLIIKTLTASLLFHTNCVLCRRTQIH